MGIFQGKVAFITGAGRGQGRSHAIRIASEGADVALLDIGGAAKLEHPPYPTATGDDLLETKKLAEEYGVRVLSFEVDVRDHAAVQAAADETAEALGGIDYVVANAGIADAVRPLWEIPPENWKTVIDVNLSGVFHTCRATVPHIRKRGPGGALVLVSSASGGYKAMSHMAHYVASKFGVRGLALALAKELGPDGIRCNSLHPGAVDTDMPAWIGDISGISRGDFLAQFSDAQMIPKIMEPRDTTAAVVWLLSDEARYVTGLEMCVDAGETKK